MKTENTDKTPRTGERNPHPRTGNTENTDKTPPGGAGVAVGDAAVADLGRVAAEAAVAFTRRVMDSQGAWPSWQWASRISLQLMV